MSGTASSLAVRTAPEPGGPVKGMTGFAHRYADVSDTRIHYVIGGEGPVTVLLHGFPYSWAAWRDVMPSLAAASFTTIHWNCLSDDLVGSTSAIAPGGG